LCAALGELQKKYASRKSELRLLLERTQNLRRGALVALVKANRLTRHLTAHQRQVTGLTYRLAELKAKVSDLNPLVFQIASGDGVDNIPMDTTMFDITMVDNATLRDTQAVEKRYDVRELKKRGILLLTLIDDVRKKLLQLDVLELRCRELILSTEKAIQAFRHQSRFVFRAIYPFGFFSAFWRTVKSFFGRAYFSLRDMENITTLGNITKGVLKIAESPII
jgi:hypothetical protein